MGDGYGDARPGRSSTAVSLSCALFTSRTFHQGAKAVTVKLPQPWAVPPHCAYTTGPSLLSVSFYVLLVLTVYERLDHNPFIHTLLIDKASYFPTRAITNACENTNKLRLNYVYKMLYHLVGHIVYS